VSIQDVDTSSGLKVLEIDDLRNRVAGSVTAMINSQIPTLKKVSSEIHVLTDFLSEMMAGGKRLRPAFAYWGYRAAGGTDNAEILEAATALEFLQACALIHDDLMDDSDTRRGNPSIHKKFEALHTQNNWQASAIQFGAGGAILLGDLCLSWADEMLMNSGFENPQLKNAKQLYDLMRTELLAGQYLDLLEQAKSDSDLNNILQVITYKSAKYTIERPLHMGALLAGADANVVQVLTDYGIPLGIAFQLRDDLLGVFGDEKVTGKPAGDDLCEGKHTVLVSIALKKLNADKAEVLKSKLGNKDLSAEDIKMLQELLNGSGAVEEVEKLIAENREKALTALNSDLLNKDAVYVLANLAVAATERSS
jgi:geranylgeranyl diphosphate synthase type I